MTQTQTELVLNGDAQAEARAIATTESPMIHDAILCAMAEVGNIPKDERNEFQKYNFRGIDKVYNKVYPIFVRHGIYTTSKILHAEHKTIPGKDGKTNYVSVLNIQYTFRAKDGSFVTTEVVAEGQDSSDKASNKAMSAAHKYALFQILMIPVAAEDSDRPDPKDNPKANSSAPKATSRAERSKNVITEIELTKLWNAYFSMNNQKYNGDIEKAKADFRKLVCNNHGGEFDPRDLTKWNRDAYEKMAADLEVL